MNVAFSPGRRYGLTGPNGAGKSTFMKILAGDEEPDIGQISAPEALGILRQDHFRYEDNRVLDVVLMGNKPLWDGHAARRTRCWPSRTSPRRTATGWAELEGVIAEEDGYSAEADAADAAGGPGHRGALPRRAHARS